jgi:hypothetical protein
VSTARSRSLGQVPGTRLDHPEADEAGAGSTKLQQCHSISFIQLKAVLSAKFRRTGPTSFFSQHELQLKMHLTQPGVNVMITIFVEKWRFSHDSIFYVLIQKMPNFSSFFWAKIYLEFITFTPEPIQTLQTQSPTIIEAVVGFSLIYKPRRNFEWFRTITNYDPKFHTS